MSLVAYRSAIAMVVSLYWVCATSAASTVPTDPNDLLVRAGRWWGATPEQFPILAGLRPSDYSLGDDPNPDHTGGKVILVFVASKWSPPELKPTTFYFLPGRGLYHIHGDYAPASMLEIVAAMTRVYGKADDSLTCVGFSYFEWTVGNSILGINAFSWDATPKSQGGVRSAYYNAHPCVDLPPGGFNFKQTPPP